MLFLLTQTLKQHMSKEEQKNIRNFKSTKVSVEKLLLTNRRTRK